MVTVSNIKHTYLKDNFEIVLEEVNGLGNFIEVEYTSDDERSVEDIKIEIPYFNLYNKIKDIIKDKGCGDCNKASEDFKDKIRRKKDEQEK